MYLLDQIEKTIRERLKEPIVRKTFNLYILEKSFLNLRRRRMKARKLRTT